MADTVQMQIEAMATTAQSLTSQADDLSKELDNIDRMWSDLSARWIGKAGAAYEPAWEDWHQDATTVTAILVEHANLLVLSATMMSEHEAQSAATLGSLIRSDGA